MDALDNMDDGLYSDLYENIGVLQSSDAFDQCEKLKKENEELIEENEILKEKACIFDSLSL